MRADFTYANLAGANLTDANLKGANLEAANLANVRLFGANLANTNLKGVNLVDANLKGAFLMSANLVGANIAGADLTDANLTYANLAYTKLCEAKNTPFIPFACPDSGSFIAYKKASGHIVKLQIPKDAKRLSATGRKCRCDKAKVLEIQNLDGTKANITRIRSNFDGSFIYEVGKIVSVDNFDEDRWNECSTGIHFFVNRQEAVNW